MKKDVTPLVSVIVTTFNRKQLLKETIDSILLQTFTNLELIVVDNYSDYNFIEYCKSFDDIRIKPYQNQNNDIIAINRNFGIKKAKGAFLAFCDDDDYWHKNKLSIQIEHLKNNSNIIAVSSNAHLFGKTNRLKRPELDHDTLLGFGNIIELKSNIFSSLMINKGDFTFDESQEMKFAEDFEFSMQLVQKSGKLIKLLARPLVYYRTHNTNNVVDFNNSKNSINAINNYKVHIPSNSLKKLYFNTYSNIGTLGLKEKHNESRKYLLKALKHRIDFKVVILLLISILPFYLRKLVAKSIYN